VVDVARGGQAGRARERQVAKKLTEDGWEVIKGTTYGHADLWAASPLTHDDGTSSCTLWLIEVKSTAGGPYERFGPADRADLLAAAKRAGGEPVLIWWPPHGQMRIIHASDWPHVR
jgi:Holliday junction resolvase